MPLTRLWIVLLAALTLAVPSHVWGQTTTPAPDNPIRYNSASPVFPGGVVFTIGAQLPPNTTLSRLTLTIAPEGRPPTRINIPLNDAAIAQVNSAGVSVLYRWVFADATEVPALFSEVPYTWEFVGSRGLDRIVAASFVFTDTRQPPWISAQDDETGITLSLPIEGLNPTDTLAALRPIALTINANAGAPQAAPAYLLHPAKTTLGCDQNADGEPIALDPMMLEPFPCDPTIAAAILSDSGYTPLPISIFTPEAVQSALIADYVARAYAPLWSSADVPAWFAVGLQGLYDPAPKSAELAAALNAVRNQRLYPLTTLAQRPADPNPQWDAQAYGLVLWMADQSGLETLFQLAREVGDYPDFAAAYSAVSGNELNALLPNFELWMLAPRTASLFGLNLYLDATATPSATPSLTPPLPSLTPSWTASATDSRPTATVTATASLTPPPPTATFTPRPTSSLFTATPTPPPVATPAPDSSGRGLGLIGFGALIGVAALIFIWVGLRGRQETPL
ncbi:MAG: hypothetical protein ACOYL5_14635 [Phototrophicaceae bacterium]